MVAVVTGARLGLIGDSAMLLGSQGQLGTALLGQAGGRVTVNAASGNLVIQNQDEVLLGRGLDDVITSTYNSLNSLTGNSPTNGWQESYQRHVGNLTGGGGVNTANSKITHYAADGSEIVYTYNASYNGVACYVGNESDGAYDTLTYAGGQWTWTNGKSRVVETYDGTTGRLTSSADADGNTLTYTYTGSLLTRITTASGYYDANNNFIARKDYTTFTYNTQSLVTSIITSFYDDTNVSNSTLKTQTRTVYDYDSANRLKTVTVDLTPELTSDTSTYVTTYNYVDGPSGTSKLIASIAQSDGTLVEMTYNGAGQVLTVKQTVDTVATTTTTFNYGAGWTTVTDPQGNITTLFYDGAGRLTRRISPPAATGELPESTSFVYDANGNLLYSAPITDPGFTDIATNWGDTYKTSSPVISTVQSVEVDGGVSVYRRRTGTANPDTDVTPPSGWQMRLGQSFGATMRVTAGQVINLSVYTASLNAGSLRLVAQWRDINGSPASPVSNAYVTIPTGGTFGTADAGGLAAAQFTSLTVTVPATGVYSLQLYVLATANGNGPLNVAIAQPSVVVSGVSAPTVSYTYDSRGNVLSKTDSLGQKSLYTYDGNNHLLTRTVYADASTPQTTRYVYNGSRLAYSVSALGEVTQYIYDGTGLLTWMAQYTGTTFDVSNLASNVSPSLQDMTNWLPTADKSKVIRTIYAYDARGALATSKTYNKIETDGTASESNVTTYIYDQAGRLLNRVIAGSSGSESYAYDGLGRVISSKSFNGKETRTDYFDNASGLQTVVTMANGTIQTSTYDRAGELVGSTSSYSSGGSTVSSTVQYTSDSNGRLIRAKNISSGLSSYAVWDELGRKAADISNDGTITAYVYNNDDQVVRTIDYSNRLSTAQLDLLKNATTASASITLSQVTPTVSAANDRWTWSIYDADGRLVQTIDGLGHVMAYTYDMADRLIKTTAYATALSTTTVTEYQSAPPVVPVTITTDAANDRLTRTFYDNDGRVAAVLHAEGYVTQIEYDGAGQKRHTVTFANKPTLTGTLAQVVNVTTSTDDVHSWYLYDNAGHLRVAVDGEGNATRYDDYTVAGYAGTVTRGGAAVSVTMLTKWRDVPAATGTLEVTTYTYDQYGNVSTKTLNLANNVTELTTYAYDDVYNLTSQTTESKSTAVAGVSNNRTMKIRYDGLGRKIGELAGVGAEALATAGTNQTLIDKAWTDYGTIYAYDSAGRLISRTEPKGVTDGKGSADTGSGNDKTVYYYDNDGRLIYEIDAVGGVTKYSYNNFDEKSDVRIYAGKMTNFSGLTGGPVTSLTLSDLPAANDLFDSVSHFSYDVDGNVYQATVAVRNKDSDTVSTSEATNFDYNAFNQVKSRTDLRYVLAGNNVTTQTTMAYSRRGQLLSSTADIGAGSAYLNLATGYSYDAYGRLKTVTDANTTVTSTDYFRDGRVKTQFDGLSNRADYTYDAFGHLASLTDRNGKVTTYDYTPFDRKVTVTDPNGIVTTTTNNAYGQVVKVVDGTGSSTINVYDADGNIVSQTDGNGNITRYVHDKAGRVAFVIDRAGGVTGYGYDREDHVVETVKYLAVFTTAGTQALGDMVTWATDAAVVAAGNVTTSALYDGIGRMLTSTDANGVVTTYSYDPSGRKLKEVVDQAGLALTTTWEYNGDAYVTVRSPQGREIKYTYDAAGRVIEESVDPNSFAFKTQYAYDADGNVIRTTDPLGKVTRSFYDADNRLVFSVDPTGAVTGYTYDKEGRVTQTIRYAVLGSFTDSTTLANMATWAGNNAANDGNLVARSVYDAGGRLAYSIDAAGAVTGYTYNGDDQVVLTIRYNNLVTATGVRTLADMASWAPGQPNANAKDLKTYSVYDAGGRLAYSLSGVTSVTNMTAASVTAYTYDGEGRVIKAYQYATQYVPQIQNGQVAPTLAQMAAITTTTSDLTTRYVYDALGRLAYTIAPTSEVTGSTAGSVTAYTYDANGHVVQTIGYVTRYTAAGVPSLDTMRTWETTAGTDKAVTRSVYDAAGRVSFVIDPVGAVTSYSYNKDGQVFKETRFWFLYSVAGVQSLDTMKDWAGSHTGYSRITTYSYDNARRLITTTDAGGYTTDYDYDDGDHVVQASRYLATDTNRKLITRYAYDDDGRQAYAIDAAGSVTAYSYDTAGHVIQTVQYVSKYTTPDVRSRADMDSWAGSKASEANRVTRSVYDDGRLACAIDAVGGVTFYDYNALGQLKTVTACENGYTTAGSPTAAAVRTGVAASANDRLTSYAYDNDDRVTSIIDAQPTALDTKGAETRTWYDAFGRKIRSDVAYGSAEGDGVSTRWVFNTNGEVTQITTAFNTTDSEVTKASYDGLGRKISSTDGQSNVTTYDYYASGLLKTTYTNTGPNNSQVSVVNSYNAFGERTKVTDPNGNSGYFYYDGLGRQTWQVDAEGYATETKFDLTGEIGSVTRYAATVTITTITALPQVPTPNASKDNTTSFTYDGAGRVLSSTDGEGSATTTNLTDHMTSYGYDGLGNRTSMTNATGVTITYDYDANGQLSAQWTPASNLSYAGAAIAPATVTRYTYSKFGDRTRMVEARVDTVGGNPVETALRTTNYAYDKVGRLTDQTGDAVTTTSVTMTTSGTGVTTASVTPGQHFTYDRRGNQTSVTDANGNMTLTYYDDQNRKAVQVDANGVMTKWTYDDNDNLLSQTVYETPLSPVPTAPSSTLPTAPGGNSRVTNYTYDKANRLVTTTVVGVTTGSWNGTTWAAAATDLQTKNEYDANGNLIREKDANGKYAYSYYDKIGRKVAQVDQLGYVTKFTYDAEGNITRQVQYATKWTGTPPLGGSLLDTVPGTSVDDRITTFTYDHNGHRTSETREGMTAYTINPGSTQHPLTVATGTATINFTYNDLGLVTRKTEATGDYTSYDYDGLGRLSRVTTGNAGSESIANVMITQTLYDGLGNISATVAGVGATTADGSSGAQRTDYIYGIGGRLESKTDATGFKTTYGYDANGQVTIESYERQVAVGSAVKEARLTAYDKLGHVILSAMASRTDDTSAWTVDTTRTETYYNAFGEVVARGTRLSSATTTGAQYVQEFADYDAAGRVWRSNMDGGVVKVYGYDANGNMTLDMVSQGATSLLVNKVNNVDVAVNSLGDALGLAGTTRTINLYDDRNLLSDVKKLASANLDGTVSSPSRLISRPMTITIAYGDVGDVNSGSGDGFQSEVRVKLSDLGLKTEFGSGPITVKVYDTTSNPHTESKTFGATDMECVVTSWLYTSTPGLKVDVLQGTTVLATTSYTLGEKGSFVQNKGFALNIEEVPTGATTFAFYARASGSTGAYDLVTTTQIPQYAVPLNAFTLDTQVAPFNGVAGTWEVKYLATDASGNVVDARGATVTFSGSYPATPVVSNFTPVPKFGATPNGTKFNLTDQAPAGYISTSLQTYNAFGDIVDQTDANGGKTYFTYDVMGHLTKKVAPSVDMVNEAYDQQVVYETDTPIDEYYYDMSGRLIAHKDPNGHEGLDTTYRPDGYFSLLRLVAGTGYGGSQALVGYQRNADGTSTHSDYNVFGGVWKQYDGAGYATVYTYDGANRVKTVSHATRTADAANTDGVAQLVDTFTYDGLGQRIKHSNNVLSGGETTYYDLQGRVTKTVTFGAQVTNYSYVWTAKAVTTRVSGGQVTTAGTGDAGVWQKTTTTAGHSSTLLTDYFGATVQNVDFGGHRSDFVYNQASQLVKQYDGLNTSTGRSMLYTYTTTGQVASITDERLNTRSVYAYDKNGNRTLEAYYNTSTGEVFENASVTFDKLNRVTRYNEDKADITYAYDANSNRREIKSVYQFQEQTEDYWYRYDKADRFLIAKGTLNTTSHKVELGTTTGIAFSYNGRGDRTSATYGKDGHVEDYDYTADGYLKTVSTRTSAGATSYLAVSRKTDVLGRLKYYAEYDANGSTTTAATRTITYDADGKVTHEDDSSRVKDSTGNTVKTYNTSVDNTYSQGQLLSSTSTQTEAGTTNSTVNRNDYTYVWWGGAKTNTVSLTVDSVYKSTSTYSYDVNGNTTQVYDSGNDRRQTYRTDIFGQVMHRQEEMKNSNGVWEGKVWREFVYFNGRGIGDIGYDKLPTDVDYGQQLANDRGGIVPTGPSTPSGPLSGGFDTSYSPYNTMTVGQVGSSYTANAGDTLQSVALAVWGDSSLWYVLAEANGLGAGTTLSAGQVVTIPSKGVSAHNNTGTFKPYDANDAMGNTSPTQPQPPAPKQQGCGTIGVMLVMIVAVVVTAVVAPWATGLVTGQLSALSAASTVAAGAGAAGAAVAGSAAGFASVISAAGATAMATGAAAVSATTITIAAVAGGAIGGLAGGLASQAFAVATGIQDRINWGAVATGAIAAGAGGAFSTIIKGTGFTAGMARGLAGNATAQGVNMALGLQKKFDWAGLAVGGMAGGVSGYLGKLSTQPSSWYAQMDGYSQGVIAGTASLLAGATTKSILTGQDFGKSLQEALPDAIANTVGSMIGNSIVGRGNSAYEKMSTAEKQAYGTAMDRSGLTQNVNSSGNYIWLDDLPGTLLGDFDYKLPTFDFAPEDSSAFINNLFPMSGPVSRRTTANDKYAPTASNLTSAGVAIDGRNILNVENTIEVDVDPVTGEANNLGAGQYLTVTAYQKNIALVPRFFKGEDEPSYRIYGMNGEHSLWFHLNPLSPTGPTATEVPGWGTVTATPRSLDAGYRFKHQAESSFQQVYIRDGRMARDGWNWLQESAVEWSKHPLTSTLELMQQAADATPGAIAKALHAAPELYRYATDPFYATRKMTEHVARTGATVYQSYKAAERAGTLPEWWGRGVGEAFPTVLETAATEGGSLVAGSVRALAAPTAERILVNGLADNTLEVGTREVVQTGENMVAGEVVAAETAEVRFAQAAADGPGCFVAGTLVHTKGGLKPVEAIQVGDVVVSQPQFTGEIGFRPVVNTFIVGERPVVEVSLRDGAGRTQTIRSTSGHPFWVEGREWTAAEDLKPGDVLELHDRGEITVVGVVDTGEIEPVFNFTVDGFHTYYVGELGVWVHNASSIAELTATQMRNTPGVATVSGDLVPASGRWLDPAVSTPIPSQVGDALAGRTFNTFDDMRAAVWEHIGTNPELNGGFSRANLAQMEAGNAPFAPLEYQNGTGAFGPRFNLHHDISISRGGPVYDLSNLRIVSPKVHYDIHYGF